LAAVFFDLDGTLLDTAPDMVAALDALRADSGLPPMRYALARAWVSNGAAGMIQVGFDHLDEAGREALRAPFLERYAARLTAATRPFEGIAPLLEALDRAGVAWGVVTNKPAFLTEPLLEALQLRARCVSVVSGDSLPHRKPHPAPLQHAAELAGCTAAEAVYVGDARRDIEAGRAAGMRTIAAAYGYIQPGDDPRDWGADHVIDTPAELRGVLAGLSVLQDN